LRTPAARCSSLVILLLLWVLLVQLIPAPRLAVAGPAAGIPETLTQPDGSTFVARQVGDEWANGMEALDGYLILRHPATRYWMYAESVPGSGLRPSALVVGQHAPAGIPQRLRPERVIPVVPIANSVAAVEPPTLAPALGSRTVLTLFVDFTPSVRVGATPPSLSTTLFGPTGSAKKYYEETSYGLLTFTPAVESDTSLGGLADDGVVSVTLGYPHPNTGSTIDDANRQIVHDALLAADPFVNFAAYDTNSDGVISADELIIVVIVAGYERSYGSVPCGPSVWGHKWSLGGSVPTVSLDGKTVGGTYTQVGEWHCTSSAPPGHQATIGIVAHELGHDLGLPDLYDIDKSSEGIGKWGIMGSGSWNGVSAAGDSPAHMDPWSKFFLGWISPTLVTGTLPNETISPAETTADVYQFLAGTPTSGEYFLVENRQFLGFDAGLPGQGLVIWHIDTAKTSNAQECHPGIDCNTYHYKVAVVQADNLYHLELGDNRGDGGDPWPGTTGKQTVNDTSAPNSRLYNGASSGVSITGITVAGTNITATLGPPLAVTDLTPDKTSPQVAGTPITFTATATGGVPAYQYKWWLFNGTTWTVGQAWGASSTFAWTPTAPGTYTLQVWVRSNGNTADTPEAYRQVAYTVTILTFTSLTAALPSPQPPGTLITFTATATGGVAPYQYKWWEFNGTTWRIVQDWNTSATFAWTPTAPGTYTLQVWARNSGTTTDTAEAYKAIAFTISNVNLAAYQPSGWPDAIVVAAVSGSRADGGTYIREQTFYLNFVVGNYGAGTALGRYSVTFYDNDGLIGTGYVDNHAGNSAVAWLDVPYAFGTAGTHALKMVIDSTNAIAETNEADNVYSKVLFVN
jgi:M6 family metalloprotease-like protein